MLQKEQYCRTLTIPSGDADGGKRTGSVVSEGEGRRREEKEERGGFLCMGWGERLRGKERWREETMEGRNDSGKER